MAPPISNPIPIEASPVSTALSIPTPVAAAVADIPSPLNAPDAAFAQPGIIFKTPNFLAPSAVLPMSAAITVLARPTLSIIWTKTSTKEIRSFMVPESIALTHIDCIEFVSLSIRPCMESR